MASPVAVDALLLSVRTTAITMAILLLVGTPAAYVLARGLQGESCDQHPDRHPCGAAAERGRHSVVTGIREARPRGTVLERLRDHPELHDRGRGDGRGLRGRPFLRQAGRHGFRRGRPDGGGGRHGRWGRPLEEILQGYSTPGLPALVAGALTAWARALGEFGATIIFAGSFRGVTQTIPLAIFAEFQRDLDAAVALSVLVLGFAFAVILAVRYLTADLSEIEHKTQPICA